MLPVPRREVVLQLMVFEIGFISCFLNEERELKLTEDILKKVVVVVSSAEENISGNALFTAWETAISWYFIAEGLSS